MPYLDYVAKFESVQLLMVFGIGMFLITILVIRYMKRSMKMRYDHEDAERRFKLLEMDKRPQKPLPPPSNNY